MRGSKWHTRLRRARRPRRATLPIAVVVVVLLGSCTPESPNGHNYGWVSDVSGLHATCGAQEVWIETYRVDFTGISWKEATQDAVCNYQSDFVVGAGHLGASITARRNGVICSQRPMSYSPYDTYAWTQHTSCSRDGNDNYYATVVHHWWSSTNQNYAQVTKNSVTVTA